MEVVVALESVSKFLNKKPIIVRMNLSIPRGALFGLLGPNGAGKTTTLNLMTGRLKPTSGKVTVLGLDPWKERVPLFRKIGFLAQNPTQHADKSTLRFLVYMSRLRGYSREEAYRLSRDAMERLGLSPLEQNIVGKLSGGEKQRLGFANALIGDPELLILDEPTASLDPKGRVYVMDLITRLAKEQNQTIIISSHILPEIQRMTNYVAIMSSGRVLVTGNVRDLTRNVYDENYILETDKPKLFVDQLINNGFEVTLDQDLLKVSANGNIRRLWSEVIQIAHEKNFLIKSFHPEQDPLESVFLKLVSTPTLEDPENGEISQDE